MDSLRSVMRTRAAIVLRSVLRHNFKDFSECSPLGQPKVITTGNKNKKYVLFRGAHATPRTKSRK